MIEEIKNSEEFENEIKSNALSLRHQRTADKRMPLTDNKRSYKSLLIRYGTIFQGLQELINQRYRPLR